MDYPFDTVVLRDGDGRRSISPDAFFDLPLQTRIRHILSGTAEFVRSGESLPTRDVLKAMHAAECNEQAAG